MLPDSSAPQSPVFADQSDEAAQERIRALLRDDTFAALMGFELVEGSLGLASLRMTVGENHLNFYGTVHGGVIFSLADAAFGLACNSQGEIAMAIGNHITYAKTARVGETITATAREATSSKRVATYDVRVLNEPGDVISTMTATAFRSGTKAPHPK